jgi:thiol:disulfide interchange protein DsbD
MVSILAVAVFAASPSEDNLVHVSISQVEHHVRAGRPFTLSIDLEIEKGWHIYWINPGETGTPTTIDWQLPKGFEKPVKTIWPVPERFTDSGLTSYGYQGKIQIQARFKAPAGFVPGKKAKFGVDLSWLASKELNKAGEGSAELVVSGGAGGGAALLSHPSIIASDSLTVRSTATHSEDFLYLNISAPTGLLRIVEGAYFFAEEPGLLDPAGEQSVERSKYGLRVTIPKSQVVDSIPKRIKGILAAPPGKHWFGSKGAHGIEIDAELKPGT